MNFAETYHLKSTQNKTKFGFFTVTAQTVGAPFVHRSVAVPPHFLGSFNDILIDLSHFVYHFP